MSDAVDRRRRAVLAAAGGGLAVLAGCLSNPWSPGAGEETDTGADEAVTGSDGGQTGGAGGGGGTDGGSGNETDGSGDGTSGDDETGSDGESGSSESDEPPEPDVVVKVAPDGYRFDPENFAIRVGGTVKWVWRANGHNVRVDSKPDGSDWSGTAGGAPDTYNEGHELLFTFETAGQYEYYCATHRSLGLRGSFTVVE